MQLYNLVVLFCFRTAPQVRLCRIMMSIADRTPTDLLLANKNFVEKESRVRAEGGHSRPICSVRASGFCLGPRSICSVDFLGPAFVGIRFACAKDRLAIDNR